MDCFKDDLVLKQSISCEGNADLLIKSSKGVEDAPVSRFSSVPFGKDTADCLRLPFGKWLAKREGLTRIGSGGSVKRDGERSCEIEGWTEERL